MSGVVGQIVVCHPDRLARFGCDLIRWICEQNDCQLVVLGRTDLSPERKMVEDLLAIIHVFNGLRKYKSTIKEDKIRVYPETKLAAVWRTWIAASRWCKAASNIRVKIRNLISELHKKTAKYLCDKYKVIFLPTFETQQMVKKGKRRLTTKTARAMVTLSHYKFKQTLKHQAAKHGCIVVNVTEEWTSKTCSKCGHIHRKLGGNKCFTCPDCGHKLDRDLNGAFNILLKALRDTSLTGILADFQVLPYSVILDCQELPG